MGNRLSLSNTYPEIAKEWHPTKNGELSPDFVTPKSGRKVWWLGACGHEWQAVISHRTDGQNCPICSNHKLLAGFNDLATKFPNIADEWHPVKNGQLTPSDVFSTSNRKVWWLGKCGHEWQVAISCRTKNNNGCPICSGYRFQSGINDLKTINPALAAEWDYEKNIVYLRLLFHQIHIKKSGGFARNAVIVGRLISIIEILVTGALPVQQSKLIRQESKMQLLQVAH